MFEVYGLVRLLCGLKLKLEIKIVGNVSWLFLVQFSKAGGDFRVPNCDTAIKFLKVLVFVQKNLLYITVQ